MKNMKHWLMGPLMILLVGGPTVLAQTEQPPLLHRGDAARSGVIEQPPIRAFSDVRWQIETPDPGYSSPLVVDQTLYIGSLGGTVRALDVTTGAEIWSVQPIDGAVSPIQLRGASELVLTIGASLVVMDRESGRVEWQFDADGEVWFSPPLIVDRGPILVAPPKPITPSIWLPMQSCGRSPQAFPFFMRVRHGGIR